MHKKDKAVLATIAVLSLTIVLIFPTSINAAFVLNTILPDHEIQDLKTSSIRTASAQTHEQATDTLNDYTNARVMLFEKVENSVVQITSKVSTVNSHIIINGNPLEQQSTRLGSGFVYDMDGHILTNEHVVDGTKTVDVTFVDGNIYTAEVIGKDVFNDIAVLKITDDFSDEKLVPLPFGDSDQLKVGQPAIAIGNPFGLSDTMTAGIISQTGRLLPISESGFSIPNVIQTDAAINPGNSGGPLLNIEGQVIGMNTAIKSNTGEFSGIGFAVPSNTLKRIVPVLIEDGSYTHPWIGISGQTLNPDTAKSLGLPQNYKGVFVSSVVKDGPAAKAGFKDAMYNANQELKQADVIVSIDGNAVKGIDEVISYIADKAVGDEVIISVNRDDNIIDLTVVLGERPSN